MTRLALFTLLLALLPAVGGARAGVVDASQAEAAYTRAISGGTMEDFRAARDGFEQAIEDYKAATKDNTDRMVYREALYLYDRLADCCFGMKDFEALKKHSDMLWKLVNAEQNLVQGQLGSAFDSGVAVATARFIADQLSEAVRLKSIFQLKRTVALLVLESRGGGSHVRMYQEVVLGMRSVLSVEDGAYVLDVRALNEQVGQFEATYAKLPPQDELTALWDRHRPATPQ